MPPDYRFFDTLTTLAKVFLAHAGRQRAMAAMALMTTGALLEGIGLALLVPLLTVLDGRGHGELQVLTSRLFDTAGVDGRLGRAAVLLGLFVFLVLARAAVLARRDALLLRLQLGFIERQRSLLLTALANARWADVAGLRYARVTQALDVDVERTAAAVHILLQVATSATMLAAQGLIVLLIAPAMGAFALALIAIGGALLLPVLRRASRLGRTLASNRAWLAHSAAQLLGGLKLAVAQNLQHAFIDEFEVTARIMTADRAEFMRRFSRSRIVGTSIGALAGTAVVLGGLAIGTPVVALVAAVAVFTRMVGPVTTIGQNAQQITDYLPGFAALDALRMELADQVNGPSVTAIPALPNRAPLRMRDVTYLHGDGAGVQDVSVTLAPGEVIGVTGPSGAGKTTFVDLLAGLLEPQGGEVMVGEVSLAAATREWRDRIAYVGQDSYLFNDSLRRNLSLGLSQQDDAALWAALDTVGAASLVHSLPDGLDTSVAERGARLSGGQRQRIAIARAILRSPDLLVLDEATNALDVAGEAAIFGELIRLRRRPTIVVVAHRTETLRWCNRLLRFEAGRLVV